MRRAAPWVGCLLLASLSLLRGAAQAAGGSRFVSYDSEGACVASGIIAAALCRSAFANARAEYESKTPSFPDLSLCTRRYAACMAWPPGADPRRARYRPRWEGVDIVDTPTERSVTPSPGSTGKAVRFAAWPLTEAARELVIRGTALPGATRPAGPPLRAGVPGGPPVAQRMPTGPRVPERALPPGEPPPPGSGFKLEDGVLTYPAPARFQPRNLPKRD